MKTKHIFIPISIFFLLFLIAGCATTLQYSDPGSSASISKIPQAPFDVRLAQANNKQPQDYNRSKRVGFTSRIGFGHLISPGEFVGLSEDQKQIVNMIGLRNIIGHSQDRTAIWLQNGFI